MFIRKHRPQLLQFSAFTITAVLYCFLHAARTAWAYSKPTLSQDLGLTDNMLAWLDCAFLVAYAIGLFLSGWLGDRLKLKVLLFQGISLAILAITTFAIVFGFMRMPSLWIGIPLFLLNGLGQSTAFPGFMTILANWFPPQRRGLIFGIWMININLGNIVGQQLGKVVIEVWQQNWAHSFLIIAGSLFILTILMLRFVYTSPFEAGFTQNGAQRQNLQKLKEGGSITEVDDDNVVQIEQEEQNDHHQARGIGFWEAWKISGVLLYAIVFTATKAAIIAMMFWLPSYLKIDLGFEKGSANLLACMEIGQLFGIVMLGYISDKFKSRAIVITGSLLIAACIFFGISFIKSAEQQLPLMALFILGGIFAGGPAGLIVGALSSDLSTRDKNSKVKATSTITGIIDGSGTIGAALMQPILPLFRESSFVLYTICFLTGAIVTPFASRQASYQKGMEEEEEVPYQQNDIDTPQEVLEQI